MSLTVIKKIEEYNLEIIENKLINLCRPLFDNSHIHFFQYDRCYADRSRIMLSTSPSWLYGYYNSNYYQEGLHYKPIQEYETGYNFWGSVGRSSVIEMAREKYDIDNGFTIIERSSNVCEFYHFASFAGNSQIINFYINHLNLLRRFIAYFKCEGRDLIEYCKKDRVCFNVKENSEYLQKKTSDESINACYKDMTFSRFYFNLGDSEDYLTKKEWSVAKWLIQGKTSKEIGVILGISSKTVETYINILKIKLGCYKQTLMVQKLLSLGVNTE